MVPVPEVRDLAVAVARAQGPGADRELVVVKEAALEVVVEEVVKLEKNEYPI